MPFTAASISSQLEKNKGREYQLKIENEYINLKGSDTAQLIEIYVRNYTRREEYRVSVENMNKLLHSIGKNFNTTPIDAKITIVNGVLTSLHQEVPGKKINISRSSQNIVRGLAEGRAVIELAVDYIEPNLTVGKMKNLEINALLAKGKSDFAGSPPSRVHNIKTGALKFNGQLIPPGKVFSFNESLGEVNEKTGYLPELVIKNKRTIPEYGGGLCQVSTTLFRAALNAGLPIIERKNHSFPVRYYDPQGLDATIYPGVVDLKFKNDTDEYILIQTQIEETKLIFEIYGKDDGRKITVTDPLQSPRENGGLYASVTRTIEKDGKTIKKSFESWYRSKDEYPLERNLLE